MKVFLLYDIYIYIKCKQTNTAAAVLLIPYNSLADAVRLLAEQSDTMSNVKLAAFRSQLQASYVSSHSKELRYNETVCLCMTI